MKRTSVTRHRAFTYIASLVLLGFLPSMPGGFAEAQPPESASLLFGTQPGGRTIGGPGQITLRSGTEEEIFEFLRSGTTPVRFLCLTGANLGPGKVSVRYSSRIGESGKAQFGPGETRVVCGETTAIKVDCQGPGTECRFLWRVDEPK